MSTRLQPHYAEFVAAGAIILVASIAGALYALKGDAPPVGAACAAEPSEKRTAMTIDYPLHESIRATVFWAGENASGDNDHIHNHSSAWIMDWTAAFGGVDTPEQRSGCLPAGFVPKENPFYFALPYGDYENHEGDIRESVVQYVPWYKPFKPGQSILKNRWIEVHYQGRTAYAQWEDVGPFEEDDPEYVFGGARPKNQRAALDLSPATAHYLQLDGSGDVSWRFIEEADIPAGPWKKIITRSQPDW